MNSRSNRARSCAVPISPADTSDELIEWSKIHFGQTAEIDLDPNLVITLKDELKQRHQWNAFQKAWKVLHPSASGSEATAAMKQDWTGQAAWTPQQLQEARQHIIDRAIQVVEQRSRSGQQRAAAATLFSSPAAQRGRQDTPITVVDEPATPEDTPVSVDAEPAPVEAAPEHPVDMDSVITLKDSSVAPYGQHLDAIYEPERLGYRPLVLKDDVSPTCHAYDQHPCIDYADIVKRIQLGDIPRDWLAIVLTPKGKELKLEARLYAQATPPIRAYLVLTENTIAKHFSLHTQHTMGMSETSLEKRLFEMLQQMQLRKGLSGAMVVWIVINVDFARSNLQWQELTSGPTFRMCDDLLGTPARISST